MGEKQWYCKGLIINMTLTRPGDFSVSSNKSAPLQIQVIANLSQHYSPQVMAFLFDGRKTGCFIEMAGRMEILGRPEKHPLIAIVAAKIQGLLQEKPA